MKKRVLPFSLFLILIVLAGFTFDVVSTTNSPETIVKSTNVQSVERAIKPAAEYLETIRNNQISGIINPDDVISAQNQIQQYSSRTGLSLDWNQSGPDNFGGRTRAILFDNKDTESNTIYAAAVSGGVWKSVNGGITWKKINQNNSNLYATCMKQAANGDIFLGTGESFSAQLVSGLQQMGYSGGFMGQGVFKSTDGDNFTLLDATVPTLNNDQSEWAFVNELAIDDGNSRIFAATNTGLKFSNNGGEAWSLAKDVDGNELAGNAYDVQVGSDGTVVAAVNNLCYISPGGVDTFVLRSTGDSVSLPNANIGRLEFAIAPSNPEVIYASVAGLSGDVIGIYMTNDGGGNWNEIMPPSTSLDVFNEQGIYNNTIAVFPNDPTRVLLGGIDMWYGKEYDDGFFSWETVSESASSPFSPYYVHADHHTYVFKPGSNNAFFIGTDGGIAEGALSQNEFTFKTNNRNYFTTQFYAVGYSGLKDFVLGGTQDNGSILVTGDLNTDEQGVEIFPGDCGPCAVSLIHPSILVLSSTNGTLKRSEDAGATYSTDLQFLDDGTVGNAQAFKTPIALWESFDNENSGIGVWYFPRDTVPANSTVKVRSHNSGQPFWYTTPDDITLYPGDSIFVQDIVSALLFVPVANAVWMTWDLHQFDQTPEWFTISNGDFGFAGTPHSMAYSSDGNHIFVGTKEGRLFRISNLLLATTYELADVNSPECIVSTQEITLTMPGTDDLNSQVITSVAIDPENTNNVLITLGNYGNDHYVLYCNNALAQTPTFESKQGNLPQMPVYSSVIEMNDGNIGIIGTEYGIYTTQNLKSESPNWIADAGGMGSVPVFDLKQQIVSKEYMQVKLVNGPEVIIIDYWGTNNYGSIYAATYGRGMFRSDNYFLVDTDDKPIGNNTNSKEIELYPNPVSTVATIKLESNINGEVHLYVFDLSGRMLLSKARHLSKGMNQFDIDMSDMKPGAYVIKTVSGNDIRSRKFIVK